MNDIKVLAKNEKELETLLQTIQMYCQVIGMGFSTEKCAMLIMKSEQKNTKNRRNRTAKSRKNQNA